MSVHYDTYELTKDQKVAILRKAKEVAYNWWVDTLDCRKSWFRERIEMSFEEVMEKFDGSCMVIIHRDLPPENYLEIGFRTGREPEYFLWLMLDVSHIPEFTEGLQIL